MPFQILCLSGGGYLGLYTAAVLYELEKKLGRPIVSCFDLVAGTSIGGIIALGLAKGCSAKQIKAAFEKSGTQIFSDRPAPRRFVGKARDFFRSLRKPKYNSAPLRKVIEDLVGDETRVRDLPTRVLIPALNVSTGQPQAFKTPHHANFVRDGRLKIADVALATSAAPTYFPLAEVDDQLFADGGLYANSPDLMAIHEAEHFLNVPTDQIRLLSIGTTTIRYSFSHSRGTRLGSFHWMTNALLARVMIAAQQESVDFIVRHKLQDRYVRIDEMQSAEQMADLGLDVANEAATKTIRALAWASVQRTSTNAILKDILGMTAATPVLYGRTEGSL